MSTENLPIQARNPVCPHCQMACGVRVCRPDREDVCCDWCPELRLAKQRRVATMVQLGLRITVGDEQFDICDIRTVPEWGRTVTLRYADKNRRQASKSAGNKPIQFEVPRVIIHELLMLQEGQS